MNLVRCGAIIVLARAADGFASPPGHRVKQFTSMAMASETDDDYCSHPIVRGALSIFGVAATVLTINGASLPASAATVPSQMMMIQNDQIVGKIFFEM